MAIRFVARGMKEVKKTLIVTEPIGLSQFRDLLRRWRGRDHFLYVQSGQTAPAPRRLLFRERDCSDPERNFRMKPCIRERTSPLVCGKPAVFTTPFRSCQVDRIGRLRAVRQRRSKRR
jgi:hypothetical protein